MQDFITIHLPAGYTKVFAPLFSKSGRGETDMNIGIYVHIPFCVSKCAYCDFYSLPSAKTDDALKDEYVEALVRQIRSAPSIYGEQAVDTVFFGGGTPTVLKTEQLLHIIQALKGAFHLTRNCEFTVEANPATFDFDKLTALRAAGVNRISLGVQSAQDCELSLIGRIHTFEQAKNAFNLTRNAGFDNISIDLMYGLPSQTEHTFFDSVQKITELAPEHISVYGLQLEENTPLCKNRKNYTFPSEDECISMYSAAIALLKKHGYDRYEISNFSKKGRECAHNLLYWSQGQYLGFGAGAYSYFDNRRFHTESDINVFCDTENFDDITVLDEEISDADKVTEFIMLSLRLTRGFSEKELFNRTRNASFYLDKMKKFIKAGLMKRENGRIFFTEDGFNVSNAILSEILFD